MHFSGSWSTFYKWIRIDKYIGHDMTANIDNANQNIHLKWVSLSIMGSIFSICFWPIFLHDVFCIPMSNNENVQ